MQALFGLAVLYAIALCFSEAPRRIAWRVVLGGLGLQIAIALFFLKLPPAIQLLVVIDQGIEALQNATTAGTTLVFGFLGGGPLPYAETRPGSSVILAFHAFPLILVISALSALLLHWGVLQRVVAVLAWGLRRLLGIGGALGSARRCTSSSA